MVDNADQRAQAARAFARFDLDKSVCLFGCPRDDADIGRSNGVLDANEFKAMTRAMGIPMTDNEVRSKTLFDLT